MKRNKINNFPARNAVSCGFVYIANIIVRKHNKSIITDACSTQSMSQDASTSSSFYTNGAVIAFETRLKRHKRSKIALEQSPCDKTRLLFLQPHCKNSEYMLQSAQLFDNKKLKNSNVIVNYRQNCHHTLVKKAKNKRTRVFGSFRRARVGRIPEADPRMEYIPTEKAVTG